jgi:hypothetical protein
MAEEPRRRRMSRHVSLVLLTSLPGLAGCEGGQQKEELKEVIIEPPPSGPEHVIGGPFVGWWQATHPPVIVAKTVQRSTAVGTGHTRRRSRVFFVPIGGRSGYLSGGSSSPGRGPGHAAPITRGGFGSTGHGAVGG